MTCFDDPQVGWEPGGEVEFEGGAVGASVIIGIVVDAAGWDAGFSLIIGACVIAMVLLGLTMRHSEHA